MRGVQTVGVYVLMVALGAGLMWAIQGSPTARGPNPTDEQGAAPANQPETAAPQPPAAEPPQDEGLIEVRLRDLKAEMMVRIVAEATPVDREKMFKELKARHAAQPLDLSLLVTLVTLRADEKRRDDVRAIGDWARRQIESHPEGESIVEPILTHALVAEEGAEGALLDVLDDHGRMRLRDIETVRAAFLHEKASYRLKRSILLLLPSVEDQGLPLVVPVAWFRNAVVSGKAQADELARRQDAARERARRAGRKPGQLWPAIPPPSSLHPPGGYQRERLEVQIDAFFAQIGAPALQALVTAYYAFLADPERGARGTSGWTIYDDAIVANAHLDVSLILNMALRMDPRERRLAAQALRELETKSPDVERTLEKLRNDPDRLVRKFAARR